jgi:hypothetical protein
MIVSAPDDKACVRMTYIGSILKRAYMEGFVLHSLRQAPALAKALAALLNERVVHIIN